MIFNPDGNDDNIIFGFPVVKKYKYLSVVIDAKISAKSHFSERRGYLAAYF